MNPEDEHYAHEADNASAAESVSSRKTACFSGIAQMPLSVGTSNNFAIWILRLLLYGHRL